MTIIKQTGVQSNGHMKNLRGYINDDRKVLVRDSLNMDGCTNGTCKTLPRFLRRNAGA